MPKFLLALLLFFFAGNSFAADNDLLGAANPVIVLTNDLLGEDQPIVVKAPEKKPVPRTPQQNNTRNSRRRFGFRLFRNSGISDGLD